jgi:carbonic anhydrase
LVNSTTSSQKIVNSNIPKQTETAIQRNRKILIIGDSHARGLANKIKDELGDVFTVTGIVKPNADIEGITSSLNVSRDNLTKEEIIIVIGFPL